MALSNNCSLATGRGQYSAGQGTKAAGAKDKKQSRSCWQKEFFENGAAAFHLKERPARQAEEKQKRIEFLEKKVQTKDEVLGELMAEHVALKKSLGEL